MQVSPQTAIAFLEQVWGRDLTAYDPDGPLPEIEPDVDGANITRGRVRHVADPRPMVDAWRAKAEAERLSIRELVIAVSGRASFVGTPSDIARQLDDHVQAGAATGFTLVGTRSPDGLDEFVPGLVEFVDSLVFEHRHDVVVADPEPFQPVQHILSGLGLASLFPLAFRVASQLGGHAGMAGFSSGARLGFLLASPLVGLVADATSVAIGVLAVAGTAGLAVGVARLPARDAVTPPG